MAQRIFDDQCAQCHSLAGEGKKDGIPLDHEGRRHTKPWIEVQIRRPDKHNPKTAMPLFPDDRISNKELGALVKVLMR